MITHRSRLRRLAAGAGVKAARTGLALALVAIAAAGQALAQQQQQATPIPSVGQVRVICLRVQFEPAAPPLDPSTGNPVANPLPATRFKAQHNRQYFTDVMARVRAYFLEVSQGKLDLISTIAPTVLSVTDYNKDEDYFGDNNQQAARAQELLQTAITLGEASVDYSQYDLVVVFHAGDGQESDFKAADATLILSRGVRAPMTGGGKTFAGAVLQSAGEVAPAAGEQLSIVGRTCFGIAQVLGPNGAMITGQGFSEPTSDSYVGVWDLMDRGWMLGPRLNTSGLTDWSSPAHLNPYEKARLGWLQPIQLTNNVRNAEIAQVATTGTVYRLWKEGRSGPEFFLVENRQRVGFDSYLPETGLLVWKVNEALAGQVDAQRLRLALLQADGRQDIENQTNTGDGGDCFPGQLARKGINDDSNPSTRDANGAATGVSITDVSASAQTMRASLYVVPPMILAMTPSGSFTTESVTPTFKVRFAEDIDPNTIELTLDDSVVVSQANLGSYYNAATRELTYRASQLAYGQHSLHVAVRNAAKTVMESTGSMNFRVNFRTIPAGLRMVSVPYRLAANSNTPADVFGAGNVARWVAPLGDYRYYPEHPEGGFSPGPDDPQNPTRVVGAAPAGLAYWIKLSTDAPVRVNGDQLENTEYRIPLFTGWNMVGDPFPFAVDWNGIQVEYQGVTKTMSEAVEADWLSGSLYSYTSGGYTWKTAPAGQLNPWEGYWVKAKVDCWLLVPPVPSGIATLGQRAASEAFLAEGRAALGRDGWRIRLMAQARSGAADTFNFIGAAAGARDGADRLDVEKPPVPSGGTVCLRILDGGRSLAQDLKAPDIGNGKSWEFEVNTDLKHEPITLQWPNLGELPADYRVTVEDLATGRKIYARTRGGYTYNSGEGGPRRFRLTVAKRLTAPLSVTDLTVQRARGIPSVRFNLSREASVAGEGLNASGKRQYLVTAEHAGVAGMNVVSTGRADGLQPGLYLLQVTATAADGATVRAVRPLLVTR